MSAEPYMDIDAVRKQLPHRYPFLLVDRVLECEPGKTIRALKNVTVNEPYFPGHFPHRPVMPGVMILEALAQAAGILAFRTVDVVPDENTKFYFVGIDEASGRPRPGHHPFCHPKPEDLDKLEKAVTRNTLPSTTGFFFGNNPPNEESISYDMEFINKAREAINEGYAVYYDSWW